MRAKKIVALLAATALLVAFGLTAGAAAKPSPRVRQPASVGVEVHGRADKGFGFEFHWDGRIKDLSLTKRFSQTGVQIVDYLFHRSAGNSGFKGHQLDVRIGSLGRFRAHFVPTSTKAQQPDGRCTGDPTITEGGFFVGSFAFRGERGYTTISSDRERGTVTRQGATTCQTLAVAEGERHRLPLRTPKNRRQHEESGFSLVAGRADAHLVFQARREESPQPEEESSTSFVASTYGHAGELEVARAATIFDVGAEDPTALLIPSVTEPLAEATLTPPAPFSGSATFHLDDPRTASWTGDLAVELPGLGTVPLTGEGIEAAMCKGSSNCTKTVSGDLKNVLEVSGSDGSSYASGKATSEPAS